MNELTVESAEQQSSKVIEDAKTACNIVDAESYKNAGDLLVKIRTIRKRWKEVINPIKSKAYEAWKQACSTENKVDEPFAKAEEMIIPAMLSFQQQSEQERKQNEAKNGQDMVILPKLDRIEGISTLETWSCEVESLMALIEAIAKGDHPTVCVEPNMKFLNQQAKSLKEEFNVAGCKSVKKTGYQVRANNGI